ncbi:uncharacterized protein LOC107266563 isoform X2 [Cephus cinctus]|uniref:Uncharacterized protein LOC107266563 isoform X2 n=1 Tax=Cephus cinctus TaxID=211228 RepID=A0AAJ7BSE5_CEPCN|nr:uncharacterized protein LOC107266563 isoform X2 [Cephus cinctus]
MRISVIKCQVFLSNDTMTTTRPIDMSLSLVLKQECNDNSLEDDDDDISSVSTMPLPAIPDRNLIAADDPNDEFLRLTTMVRGVYFSYLQKSLLSNYVVCCTPNKKDVTQIDLKTCAGQMELNAVRASLEASLYRQAMLKMISDIKAHTSRKKVHKKLEAFLSTPPSKVSIAVQTEELTLERFQTPDTIENKHLQDCSELLNSDDYTLAKILQANLEQDSLDQRVSDLLNEKEHPGGRSPMKKPSLNAYLKSEDCSNELEKDQKLATVKSEMDNLDDEAGTSQTKNDIHEIFGIGNTTKTVLQENDDSQDSLLQHMEDMFCESDDSSDLMTLIEKHSGVTKANIDLEIGKMCPESTKESKPNAKNSYKDNTGAPSELHANKRKLSFNNYKRMKKQATEGTPLSQEETLEDRKRRKISKIWFVERVHQVSKLKTRMTEISITNYRKHGRIKAKFLELFGESDDEDMMPDSPICIEEHLTACKERIAPWVVKHLMPFYKKKRISDRTLFKEVAKFIADMLIIENTFPEENDVSKHVQDYFRNKKSIKAKPDIYI